MKIKGLLFICIFIFHLSYSQQNLYDESLFCSETFSFGKYNFLFSSKGNNGYLIKLENYKVIDTISSFNSDKKLNGFHKIYINNKNIYIVFDALKELNINDSIKLKSKKLRNFIVSLNHKGDLLWHNFIEPLSLPKSPKDFKMADDTKKNIFIGFTSRDRIIINKDTIGKSSFKDRATIVKLNTKGEFVDIIDFSQNYRSSRIYQLKKHENEPLAITLNYPKRRNGLKGEPKKLQLINKKTEVEKKYIELDSLQMIDVIYSRPFIYIFTWEGYLFKMKNKKVITQIKITSQIPDGAEKQKNITQKKIFDNGDYLTYVSQFEFKDKDKSWDTPISLNKVYFDIKHINKNTLEIIDYDTKIITDNMNWVSVQNCKKNEIGVIIDGTYKFLKKNYTQQR